MALTELIIHRGMASVEKTESLTKQEVNEILKFGAENLFKDDEEGKGVCVSVCVCVCERTARHRKCEHALKLATSTCN